MTMMLFGDTIFGQVNSQNQRTSWVDMPHSSLGVIRTAADNSVIMEFILNETTSTTRPTSIFIPLDANPTEDYFWIVQGTALSNTSSVLIFADRIRNSPDPGPLSFITVCTSVILLDDWTVPMKDWTYSTCDMPDTGVNASGVMWVTGLVEDPLNPDWVYMLGERNLPQGSCNVPQAVLLMKVPIAGIAHCNTSLAQYLVCDDANCTNSTWSTSAPGNATQYYPLFPEALPESTIYYHPGLELWLMPCIPFLSSSIQLWYAESIEGPWLLHPQVCTKSVVNNNLPLARIFLTLPKPLLEIPAPWSDSYFFSYAPKLHPTLPWAAPSGTQAGLPFTFVSNSFNTSDLFLPGMEQVYVPQWYRMVVD